MMRTIEKEILKSLYAGLGSREVIYPFPFAASSMSFWRRKGVAGNENLARCVVRPGVSGVPCTTPGPARTLASRHLLCLILLIGSDR